MKLIIHIGLHKTGSTYIQNTFYNNYSELIKNGFLFPKTGFVNLEQRGGEPNTSAGHDLFVKAALTHDTRFKKSLLKSLLNEIATTNPSTILISAENFTNHLLGDTSRNTYSLLGEIAPTRILISLRNPYEWTESYYRDRVTSGWEFEKLPLSQFIKKHETILNYTKIIQQWKNSFGNDNVDINIYGNTLKRMDLVNAYQEYLGIQTNLDTAQTGIVNESASDHFVKSALIFNNKVLPTATARSVLTEFKKTDRLKGQRSSLLNEHDIHFIESKFQQWNKNIVNLNFLTGTIEELCHKPASSINSEQLIDFSKELISSYKSKKKCPYEYATGILKFFVFYTPIQWQIKIRRLWVGFSRSMY